MNTPSVLSFQRALDPSYGVFHAGRWDEDAWVPVKIREKAVRGTISNRLPAKAPDPARLNAQIEKPNLQVIDTAFLPPDCDTLKVSFSLRVMGGFASPCACAGKDSLEYLAKLQAVAGKFVSEGKLMHLARLYALNLANARFLWRNRLSCVDAVTKISCGQTWTFNSLEFNPVAQKDPENAQIDSLAEAICDVLSQKPGACRIFTIESFARMGMGQEVFPSQELVLDEKGKNRKSRILYEIDGTAAMHSQKIGNAIRTIDVWYPGFGKDIMEPIAVDPYGAVTSLGTAFRQPKSGCDFYSLLDGWITGNRIPADGNQCFVMACLIRGGIFGKKEE